MKKLLILIPLFLAFIVNAQRNFDISSAQKPGGASQPTINTSGSFTAFSTILTTTSSPQTISVSGTNLTNNIIITPAVPLEVSLDGSTWSGQVTITQSGGSASGTLHARIKATANAGTYSDVIQLTSIGATQVNVPFSAQVFTPTISETGSFSAYSTNAGTASADQTVSVSGTHLLANITATAVSPMEVSADGASWANTATYTQSGGSASGTLHCRVAASATAGSYSNNIALTSTSASTVNVPFSATVSNPSSSFTHFRQITIPSTVTSSDLTNFTMVVSQTITGLKTTANGGSVTNSSGFDIVFSSNNTGTTLLNWDVEAYDPTTGNITVWVKVPTISHTTNTVIFMCYGNSTITTFQGGAKGAAYDANTLARYHMNETVTGSGQTVHDATSNGIDLTTNGTWTGGQQATGQIAGSLSLLNANGDYFNFTPQTLTTFTVEGWFNTSTADINAFAFGDHLTSQNWNWFSGKARIFSGGGDQIIDGTSTTINTWTHIAFTNSGTSDVAYHNGVQSGTSSSGASRTFSFLGAINTATTSNMIFDEIIVSTVARNAAWIGAEYNNTLNPPAWYTMGAEN